MSRSVNRHRPVSRKLTGMRPRLENLEARLVLSTFEVNTTLDTVAVNLKTGKGMGSLSDHAPCRRLCPSFHAALMTF
jgi:hypothetical protein